MSYELNFHPDALDEWRKLDRSVREQFKKKLAERLEDPRVPASQLAAEKTVSKSSCAMRDSGWSMRCAISSLWCLSLRWASGSATRFLKALQTGSSRFEQGRGPHPGAQGLLEPLSKQA